MNTNVPLPSRDHYMEVDGALVRSIAVLIPKSTQGDMASTPIPVFPSKDIFIGRDEGTCVPFIQSNIVSRVHFRLYSVIYDEDQMAEYPPLVYCEDRQSINGTYVNNTLIGTYNSPRSPYLLNDGDVISIRPHWTFRFHQAKQSNGRRLDCLQARERELFKDRYTISNRLLGSGIYGKVFLANDVLTQTQVACKIVDLRKRAVAPDGQKTSLNGTHEMKAQAIAEQEKDFTDVRKKLLREIEILSKISHPNIATLSKAFRTPHSLYIFNELAAGGDLYSFLKANGSCLEDLHARIISRQITIAVEYLHANGIAHRDLKPENILVMRTGIGHRVVLTDFGCAGYICGSSGRMMSTVGTYDYVAPEVHKPRSRGYTEAIDMWSLGIITLCLLTGDPFMSFEELQHMSQNDITLKLAEAGQNYPQWRHLNVQGKDFIKKLVVLEPHERLTAKEAVNHDWFRKPTRIAVELDKLYERSIIYWSKRSNYIGVIEELPDVLPEAEKPKKVRSKKRYIVKRKSTHRKIPDAASPYFGLERHLNMQGAHTRSSLHSDRKRILEELEETDSQFINTAAPPEKGGVAKIARVRSPNRFQTEDIALQMSDATESLHRPAELITTTEVIASQLRGPNLVAPMKRRLVTRSGLGLNIAGEHLGEALKRRIGNLHGDVSTNRTQGEQSSPETSPGIRQVDARDLFGTIPIEIKAAEAAEAEHAAHGDFKGFWDGEGDEETEDDSATWSGRPWCA